MTLVEPVEDNGGDLALLTSGDLAEEVVGGFYSLD